MSAYTALYSKSDGPNYDVIEFYFDPSEEHEDAGVMIHSELWNRKWIEYTFDFEDTINNCIVEVRVFDIQEDKEGNTTCQSKSRILHSFDVEVNSE